MSEASSVVVSVTQQSRQRVPQSWTEHRKPRVQAVRRHATTSWWPVADDCLLPLTVLLFVMITKMRIIICWQWQSSCHSNEMLQFPRYWISKTVSNS